MTMTRKHQEMLAEAINDAKRWGAGEETARRQEDVQYGFDKALTRVTNALIWKLVEDNPRFDPEQFILACNKE